MDSRLAAAVLLLLASPLASQPEAPKVGTCETAVGAWEFATKTGGRILISREGTNYDVLWVAKFTNPDTGDVEPEGMAAKCTCAKSEAKLLWKCRVVFSLQYLRIGSHQKFEWGAEGNTLKSWYLAPNGTRNEGVPIRRPD